MKKDGLFNDSWWQFFYDIHEKNTLLSVYGLIIKKIVKNGGGVGSITELKNLINSDEGIKKCLSSRVVYEKCRDLEMRGVLIFTKKGNRLKINYPMLNEGKEFRDIVLG